MTTLKHMDQEVTSTHVQYMDECRRGLKHILVGRELFPHSINVDLTDLFLSATPDICGEQCSRGRKMHVG